MRNIIWDINIPFKCLATFWMYTFISSFVPVYICIIMHRLESTIGELLLFSSVECNSCTCLVIFKIYTLRDISFLSIYFLILISSLNIWILEKEFEGKPNIADLILFRTRDCRLLIWTKYVKQQKHKIEILYLMTHAYPQQKQSSLYLIEEMLRWKNQKYVNHIIIFYNDIETILIKAKLQLVIGLTKCTF